MVLQGSSQLIIETYRIMHTTGIVSMLRTVTCMYLFSSSRGIVSYCTVHVMCTTSQTVSTYILTRTEKVMMDKNFIFE